MGGFAGGSEVPRGWEAVWLLTKKESGKRTLVVNGRGVKAPRKEGGPLQQWVSYKMESGGGELWECLGAGEGWRLALRDEREEQPPEVWCSQPFVVRRCAAPGHVAKLLEMAVAPLSLSSVGRQELEPGISEVAQEPRNLEVTGEEGGCFPEGLSWSWIATAQIYPIKRIPKRVRLLWADVLQKALRRVLESPRDDRHWRILFALPKLCLRLPTRGGRKKRKAFEAEPLIAEMLGRAKAGMWRGLWDEARQAERKKKKDKGAEELSASVRERVSALVEEGRFAKAVQALDSQGIHRLDAHIVGLLKSKHPEGKGFGETAGRAPGECAQFEVDEVLKAVASFPNGTAPGGSRFRASFLQDALTIPAGDADGRLSMALTGVVNLLAAGVVPDGCAPWIAGAPLYPLRKRDGGVRPVAVGEVLRRLVAKCFCARFKGRVEAVFVEAGQVGVGVKGGAEAAVIAVREALRRGDGRLWALKLDLENAFNTVDREVVLKRVREVFPEVESWYRLCYGSPAKLFCEGEVLPFGSAQGVQQGDPLGPLLFALGLLGTCRALKEKLRAGVLSVWYLDDGTIVGDVTEIGQAWGIIQEEVHKAGLRVNQAKCELFRPMESIEPVPSELSGVSVIHGAGFELLGAPVGDKNFCEEYVGKRIAKIEAALKNLEKVDDPQTELLLIRSCLGFPKFVFALRSVPPEDIAVSIKKFDAMLSSVLRDRLGISLTEDQERQVRMPTIGGGLGVEKAADVAESAYLGNVLATRELVLKIIGGPELQVEELRGVTSAFEAWKVKTGSEVRGVRGLLELPEMRAREGQLHPQRVLAAFVHRTSGAELLRRAQGTRDELRLRAVAREDAGAWLKVVPVKQLGLKFDRDEFLVMVKWWLGIPVYAVQEGEGLVCPECGVGMDVMGDHAVVCAFGPSRTGRHDGVNRVWAGVLKGAGLPVKMEVYTDPGTMRRSADTLVDNWEFGRSAAHDWVVTHALQKAAFEVGKGRNADYAVEHAEIRKESYAKVRCEKQGLDFVPLAMDSFGGFGEAAKKAIGVAVAHARIFRGNALCDRSLSRLAVRQRLLVAGMRGVARQLLRRLTASGEGGVED